MRTMQPAILARIFPENALASATPSLHERTGVSERTTIKWSKYLTFRRFPAASCRELQLLSRDHEDECATWQLVPRYRGIGSEAYLERYVAGADTRGRQEGRPYSSRSRRSAQSPPLRGGAPVSCSQQVIHEISGLVLMALLLAMTVACATPSKQPNTYEECISLCSQEVTRCTRSCYNWKWSAQQSLDCVRNCNQKSAECQQQCSTLKNPIPGQDHQGGDLG